MKKRFLFVLILTLVFMLLATMQVYADQRGGSCSDTVSWTYDSDDQVLRIYGSGELPEYAYRSWENKKVYFAKKIIIDEGITKIGNSAIGSINNLEEVDLPKSLKEIGNSAFYINNDLTTVNLSEGLEKIGSLAFGRCYKLVNIELPKTVTYIGDNAFEVCSALESISIPEGVTTINPNTFRECENLASVTLPSTLKEIGSQAFYKCSKLTNISLPEGVTKIGSDAFDYCDNLVSITIPESITKIEEKTFFGSGLKSVTIPASIKEIGSEAFYHCDDLTDVYYKGDISQWYEIEGKGGLSSSKVICSNTVNINNGVFTIPETVYEYTGDEIKPEIEATFNDHKLEEGKDYTVIYTNNVKEGAATIKITGIGNFTGQKEIKFEIFKNITWENCEVSLDANKFTYTGNPITPKVTVTYKSVELKEGTDYSVKYENNISVGKGTVSVTGIGYCKGSATEYFTINKASNSITTSKNTYTLNANGDKDQSFSLEAKAKGGTLSFESSAEGVTVSSNGIVTIKKGFSGEADIEIDADGDNYESTYKFVTVVVKKLDNSITTSKNTYKFKARATKDRVFSLKTKAGGNISYSSNKYAVTVSDDGKVTIEKGFVGEATIKIKASGKGYKKATHEVKVVVSKAVATKVKMPKTKKIGVGSTSKIEPTLVYDCEKLTGLKWSSSNKKVATITSKGEIKAKKKGTTTITCTLKNGKKFKCKVKVVKNEYVEQRYSTVSFSDDRYGDVKVEFLDAHYKGKTLIVNLALYNNRIFYAKKFDWIKFKVNYNYKTVKTCTKKNVKIKLGAYDKRKITVKIPMKKVYDLVGAESFYVYDDDYWYTFTY